MTSPRHENDEPTPAAGDGAFVVARAHLVCGECRHARVHAVLPRAVCTCRRAGREGRVVFSGRPACDQVEARRGDDRMRAWCSLQATTSQLRRAGVRPHFS